MLTFAKHVSVLKEHGLIDRFIHVILLGVHALIPGFMDVRHTEGYGIRRRILFFYVPGHGLYGVCYSFGTLRWFSGLIGVALPVALGNRINRRLSKSCLTDFSVYGQR